MFSFYNDSKVQSNPSIVPSSAPMKSVNINSILNSILIYCHLCYTTMNYGEEIMALYQGVTVPPYFRQL